MSYHLFEEKDRTAAKPHRCIWCGEPIAVGERYKHERSVYDGTFQNHHWHFECLDDAREGDWGDNEFIPYSAERPQRENAGSQVG